MVSWMVRAYLLAMPCAHGRDPLCFAFEQSRVGIIIIYYIHKVSIYKVFFFFASLSVYLFHSKRWWCACIVRVKTPIFSILRSFAADIQTRRRRRNILVATTRENVSKKLKRNRIKIDRVKANVINWVNATANRWQNEAEKRREMDAASHSILTQ